MIYLYIWLKTNIVVANQPFVIRIDSNVQMNRVDFNRNIEKIRWHKQMA